MPRQKTLELRYPSRHRWAHSLCQSRLEITNEQRSNLHSMDYIFYNILVELNHTGNGMCTFLGIYGHILILSPRISHVDRPIAMAF
jgi:hypothetical protein